jgi:hypothetical protein
MRMLLFVVVGLALAACSKPAPLGPQPRDVTLGPSLNADQIRGEMVGNTGSGTRTATTSIWSMYVAPDGTLAGKLPVLTDTGTWRISDDGKFCMTWNVDFRGQEVCQSVHRGGTIGLKLASPDTVEELVFAPGNKL